MLADAGAATDTNRLIAPTAATTAARAIDQRRRLAHPAMFPTSHSTVTVLERFARYGASAPMVSLAEPGHIRRKY